MPRSIDRDEVQRLMTQGAQLVEVLPSDEYLEQHLPGAIGIPLRRIDAEAPNRLEPAQPVIVYCWDPACDLSPRAAWRLESLGFEEVLDYEAGKQDWMAAGLPVEGTLAALPRASDVARRDVPTCGPREPLGAVRDRTRAAGWDVCVVVNAERVVLGILREEQLAKRDDEWPAERAMRPGPSTFRPDVDIREMAGFMAEHDLASSPITTSDGRLVGLLLREDAERAAQQVHVRDGGDEDRT